MNPFNVESSEISQKDTKERRDNEETSKNEIAESLFGNEGKQLDKFDTSDAPHKTRLPSEGSGGSWTGEPGNSEWRLDRNYTPEGTSNRDSSTWGQILDKYDIKEIPFKDGYPDFSEISKADVEIDDFSTERYSNFTQADEKYAEEYGNSPREIKQWRKDNNYTWHECEDEKTLQLVPTEIHGNIPHSGGISEAKAHSGGSV
jgi:hypothetical protein